MNMNQNHDTTTYFRSRSENRNRDREQNSNSKKRNGSATDPFIRRHTTPEMAASAAYGMVLCGSDELEHRYKGRIEKVKFGVPINEAFAHDIPATLLVLLLKVNKEGPLKKDIWRAPGNQAQVRKLSHIMQHGRLVNISNISVYTAASVIKRFLAKLPGGIFGVENERELFEAVESNIEDEQQRELFCRIVASLPLPSQHLMVLLFGTFHVITDSAEAFGTRMTPDAIGISVAPSLFHTCIHDGQRAKLEDIMRFKLASQVISKIIQAFGNTRLFPRECYEFYARITGRTLLYSPEQWKFSFQLPSSRCIANSASNGVRVVSRRSSRRSRRKSSTSSAASILSQMQAVRAAAAASSHSELAMAHLNTCFPPAIEEPEPHPEQPLLRGRITRHGSNVSADSQVVIATHAETSNAFVKAASRSPVSIVKPQLINLMEDEDDLIDAVHNRRRSAFFLLSPATSSAPQRPMRVLSSSSRDAEGWYAKKKVTGDQHQQQRNTRRPPPPPPTMALQRRIDAYCVAANIDPKEQLQPVRSQHSRKDNPAGPDITHYQ